MIFTHRSPPPRAAYHLVQRPLRLREERLRLPHVTIVEGLAQPPDHDDDVGRDAVAADRADRLLVLHRQDRSLHDNRSVVLERDQGRRLQRGGGLLQVAACKRLVDGVEGHASRLYLAERLLRVRRTVLLRRRMRGRYGNQGRHDHRRAERVQLQRASPRDVDVDAAGAEQGDGRSGSFKCLHHFFVAEFDCSASATFAADVVRGS